MAKCATLGTPLLGIDIMVDLEVIHSGRQIMLCIEFEMIPLLPCENGSNPN